MDSRPIGIFDSGVGGLTVVKEVMNVLPHEQIIYFGDTARVPYGSKSKETVTKFSKQMVRFLISKDVKAIIVACNTVSSNSYEELVEAFDIPILEVIASGVEACLEVTKNNKIGVIGTEATIRSQAYEKQLLKNCQDIKVYSKACPLFVQLAEEGWTDNQVAHMTAKLYLQELIDMDIDSLILGCTHYPFLMDCIQETVGPIKVVNPANMTAKKTRKLLMDKALLNESGKNPDHEFYVSDNTHQFNKICKLLLVGIHKAQKIDIEKF